MELFEGGGWRLFRECIVLLEGDKCGMAKPADVVSVKKNLWISSVCVNGIGGGRRARLPG